MGKIGGYLERRRNTPGYRPLEERRKDAKAVETRFSDAEVADQAARCMDCGTPFCHPGCPLGNLIPDFNEHVYRGRWDEAATALMSTASFPEFTGRLCPAPCEAACVLDGRGDEAVSIRQIELNIIEKAFETGTLRPALPKHRRNQPVAVVGSGPAGLATADFLNKAGYPVTVFESADRPGGLLRYGIPDFKLEKWVLDRRLDLMRKEGIEFETGVRIGKDLSFEYLAARYAATALCCGAESPRDLSSAGRELRGIHFAMRYLVRQNRKVAGLPYEDAPHLDANGKTVTVIGGGDTGSDCIGTAVRQGAKRIFQLEILPTPPQNRANDTPWPEWPRMMRTSSSHLEAEPKRLWNVSTKAFRGKDGAVVALEGISVEWEKGPDGRYAPREKPGTEFDFETELVLLAMGFTGPQKSPLFDRLNLALTARGNVKVNENHMTIKEGVFAAGDMVLGQSLIVSALADGRKTAGGIIRYLENK